MKKVSYTRLGIAIALWVLIAAALSLLFIHSVDVRIFWRQLWNFGLLALGVVFIQLVWQARRTVVQLSDSEEGSRLLVFRERMERELTELSTGFINLPLERIDDAIKHSLERVAVICNVDSCYLWLWDNQHRYIKNAYDWHADTVASNNLQWQNMDFNHLPWLRERLERGLPVHVLSPEQLPEKAVGEKHFCESFDIRAFAMMPIRFDGKVQGSVGLIVYSDREFWLQADMAPFSLIADMLSSALRQKTNQQLLQEANTQLQVLSEIDELTGIANRRYFNHQFKNIARRAARTGQMVTLLLVDIDFFKKYNDCYGHLQGDSALQKIAQRVDKSFRRADEHAARFGGEEFTVIFAAGSDPADIYDQAKKLRQQVMDLRIPHSQSTVSDYVTICIGVACMRINDPEQSAELIQMTDECLYQAKSEGRNTVVYRDIEGHLHRDSG